MMTPPEPACFGIFTSGGARSTEPGRNTSCPFPPNGVGAVVGAGVGVTIAGAPSPAFEFPVPPLVQAETVSSEAANTATTKRRIVVPPFNLSLSVKWSLPGFPRSIGPFH